MIFDSVSVEYGDVARKGTWVIVRAGIVKSSDHAFGYDGSNVVHIDARQRIDLNYRGKL